MRDQKYEFDMINTGKHPDVDIREKIHVSVLALNHMKAIKKAEWQNPCFRVAP